MHLHHHEILRFPQQHWLLPFVWIKLSEVYKWKMFAEALWKLINAFDKTVPMCEGCIHTPGQRVCVFRIIKPLMKAFSSILLCMEWTENPSMLCLVHTVPALFSCVFVCAKKRGGERKEYMYVCEWAYHCSSDYLWTSAFISDKRSVCLYPEMHWHLSDNMRTLSLSPSLLLSWHYCMIFFFSLHPDINPDLQKYRTAHRHDGA